ncbi:MAG: DPP IV N-terminal domain-containing protein [Pirellulales bacterium]|nr:DPP IV N-terminal domain-containing protein [Pirellulales bacterium]
MKKRIRLHAIGILVFLFSGAAFAQEYVNPAYSAKRYAELSRQIQNSAKLGTLQVEWKEDGKAFEFARDGKRYRYDIAAGTKKEIDSKAPSADPAKQTPAANSRRVRGRSNSQARPPRARQFKTALSPDGKFMAFCLERNLWLVDLDTHREFAVTDDGNERDRVHYAAANWTYGEELDQGTAMWWSPNGRKIAFYRFDEKLVVDYYLAMEQTKIQDRLSAVPYNKAGTPNPEVDLLIYDLDSRQTVKVDARDGKPFDNSVVGHYLYGVSWTADGAELLFHRTNRRQNIMEFCAASPATGKCRVVVREEWPASWTENSPPRRFLEDGKRFIWTSDRTGWKNFYLYELSGKLPATLTSHDFEVGPIVRLDEKAGKLYYMARDGDNPMKLQLHCVGLDGQGGKRLTDPAFFHSVDVAPDGKHFIDTAQTHDRPPVTSLMDAEGKKIAELAASDLADYDKLGLRRVELLKFKAADGKTDLYGMLHVPSNFDPRNKYPLLVSVYAGPETVGAHETFMLPNPLTECGFLVASFDSRTASGRGKRFLDDIYLKLGRVEADDQAAGVKSLAARGFVDPRRVGIFGTSYGGTMSAMCLLRYPDVFHAACACAALTDYRNYDTVYAERYMWIPQENQAGYDAACITNYAANLQGRLMIFFGTADDNVHPANSLQLIQALQRAGKSFEVQVGPDQGHRAIDFDRMMEFFRESLTKN